MTQKELKELLSDMSLEEKIGQLVQVPEMKKSRPVTLVVVLSILFSCAFFYIPLLSKISSGITITVVAIASAAVGSILFPLKDEEVSDNG